MHGRNYFFVSEADFQALIDQDRLQEHGELKGNLYGTLRPKQGGTSPKGERMVRTATYKGAVASGLGSHLAEGGVYDHRVPITTRAPREGEVNGKNYHFVSREEFESLVADDRLKEFGERNGVFYGSAKPATGSAKGRRLKRSGTYSVRWAGQMWRAPFYPFCPAECRLTRPPIDVFPHSRRAALRNAPSHPVTLSRLSFRGRRPAGCGGSRRLQARGAPDHPCPARG